MGFVWQNLRRDFVLTLSILIQLNFNEAVNFALPDWLAFGKECVTRYQLHCKPPVFSHEELLTTISHFTDSIETAIWYVVSRFWSPLTDSSQFAL
jgi:hypothetical protein